MIIEPGHSLKESLGILVRGITPAHVGTGLVATLFSTLGPGVIVINAARTGGLSSEQSISWLFGIYIFGGLATMFMALRYRIPVVTAYSIPGAVLLGTVLSNYSINEAVGAYMIIGLVNLILVATGAIKKIIDHIPGPIMLGMVAGVLLSFGTAMMSAAIKQPTTYGIMLVLYFVAQMFSSIRRYVPPIVVAIVGGVIILVVSGKINPVPLDLHLATPQFVLPTLSFSAILNISIPLFFLVIGVQNIQAVGVLLAEGYKPPINAMYMTPAVGAFVNGIFGAHPAVTAGPSTAICASRASGERKDLRFISAFSEGAFWSIFALSASVAVDAVKIVPTEFTAVLAGMAMFDVFGSVFKGAFSGRFMSGAVVAFLVAFVNIPILSVGAPLWGIVFGVVTSLLVERGDFLFAQQRAERKAAQETASLEESDGETARLAAEP